MERNSLMVPGTIPITLAIVLSSVLVSVRRRVSSKWIDLRDRPSPIDLSGRVVIVTGGNTGLGYQTALDLSRRGATVVIGCRNASSSSSSHSKGGADAVSSIRKTTGNDRVECLELDLASAESVRSFARSIEGKFPNGVHALVCNAGVWVPMERGMTTPDGYEIHFGVNHLGHFLLTKCLMDYMKRCNVEESRVVFVSSGMMKQGKIDIDKQDFVRVGRKIAPRVEDDASGKGKQSRRTSFCPTGYADSKLMNALCCKQLAQSFEATRVGAYAVCPGWCRTELGRYVSFPWYKKAGMLPFMWMLQRSSVQGAQNIVFATTEKSENLRSGGFYRDGEIAKEEMDYVESLGEELPRQLWELSEKLVKEA